MTFSRIIKYVQLSHERITSQANFDFERESFNKSTLQFYNIVNLNDTLSQIFSSKKGCHMQDIELLNIIMNKQWSFTDISW